MEEQTNKTKNKKWIAIFSLVAIVLLMSSFIFFSPRDKKTETLPQENTFYLATQKNTPVLFYRYTGFDDIFFYQFPDKQKEREQLKGVIGRIITYKQTYNPRNKKEHAKFTELTHPRKIFSFTGHPDVENILLNKEKTHLMLSFIGGKGDAINYIYQVNLKTLESKKIWEHELRSGKSPYNGGFMHLLAFIPDQYVVIAFVKSKPPPEALPAGVVIRNIQSGNNTVLGIVGDIQIHTINKTVSFKNLEKTKAPCEKNDPVCFATDTYKFAYPPSGKTITKSLPE